MSEPAAGTPEWFDRRDRLWKEKAERIVSELKDYERNHPRNAPCLGGALTRAQLDLQSFTPRANG